MKNTKTKHTKTKSIVIALVVILVLYLGYRYWKNKQGSDTEKAINNASSSGATNSITTGNSTATSQACTNSTVLKRGMSKCDRIQWSQYYINKVASKLGISKLTEDSIFGAKTENAFQKLLGKSTGTWTEVKAKVDSMSGTSTTANTINNYNLTGSVKW